MKKISVAIATFNEEENIERCLQSVAQWADEIVVVDGGSTDRTVPLVQKYDAKVIQTDNPPIFHINKQKALDACRGEWILQLDADEQVTTELAKEIGEVVTMTSSQIARRPIDKEKRHLFERHEKQIERHEGKIGSDTGEYSAFYVPRKNYFLGHPMTYAGTYPDGVVRLVKKGKAWFPAISVHEQIHVDGKVGWLYHDLLHFSNQSLAKYVRGADKYTNLLARELKEKGIKLDFASLLHYTFVSPIVTFGNLFIRHKGFMDGLYGFLFAFFSALHYPVSYIKCLKHRY